MTLVDDRILIGVVLLFDKVALITFFKELNCRNYGLQTPRALLRSSGDQFHAQSRLIRTLTSILRNFCSAHEWSRMTQLTASATAVCECRCLFERSRMLPFLQRSLI